MVSEALLNHVDYHVIDEKFLLAAASILDFEGWNLVSFLLKHLKRDLAITELFIVDVATYGGFRSPLLMEYVLQHKSDEVAVTESVVIAAIEAFPFLLLERMMRLLLGARQQEHELSTGVIKAVIRREPWPAQSQASLRILLEHMGSNVLIDEEIMELARAADDRGEQENMFKIEVETYTEILQNYKNQQIENVVERDG